MQKLLILFIFIGITSSAAAQVHTGPPMRRLPAGSSRVFRLTMPDGQILKFPDQFPRVLFVNGVKVAEDQLESVAGAMLKDPATKYGFGQRWEFTLGPGNEDVFYVIWLGTPLPASAASVRNQSYRKKLSKGRVITGVVVAYQYSPVGDRQMTGYIIEWENERYGLYVNTADGRMPQLALQLVPGDIVSVTVASGGFGSESNMPTILPSRMVKEGELVVDKTYIQI